MKYAVFFCGISALLALLVASAWWLSRRPPGPWRSRGINTLLVLIALLTPLVVAEGVFLFFIDSSDDVMATLTSRRWMERHAPKHVANRGRHYISKRKPSQPLVAIAAVGDSITFGQGVSDDRDLYPAILERELRARGVNAEVLNISGQGWNIPDETRALRSVYNSFPVFDIVVLGFCLNDMGEYVLAAPGFHETLNKLRHPPPRIAWLTRRSFVASYLYVRYVSRKASSINMTWNNVADAYLSPAMNQQLMADIREFQQLVESHGGRLVVLTFPDNSSPWESYRYHDFHTRFSAIWNWAGVPQIDLLPVFSRYPPQKLQASFLDHHPNKFAHRLAADALVEVVAKMLNLPVAPPVTAPVRRPS